MKRINVCMHVHSKCTQEYMGKYMYIWVRMKLSDLEWFSEITSFQFEADLRLLRCFIYVGRFNVKCTFIKDPLRVWTRKVTTKQKTLATNLTLMKDLS